jgi:hypothetical protein
MGRQILVRGRTQDGADFEQWMEAPALSRAVITPEGTLTGLPLIGYTTTFGLLPVITTVVATSEKLFLLTGTNAAIGGATKPVKGGVKLATAGADNDQIMLAAVAASDARNVIRPASMIRFDSLVMFGVITEIIASLGLSELITDPSPTVTAGEGALFLFDPLQAVATGLTAAQHANWILAHKVDGVDTFTATDIPVVANVDYSLSVQIGADLKAGFYINGALVGTGPALTSGDSVSAFVAIQATEAAAKNVELRYLHTGRSPG